jgi:hypothetical protein
MGDDRIVVHTDPVWRDRANFIIAAELSERDRPWRLEQLFARQVEENLFEVCCIPFFVYDLALGDVVATSPEPDHAHLVSELVEPSGRYVFRVWFSDPSNPRDEVANELTASGSLLEWSSRNLMAVDASDRGSAQAIADLLAQRERAGHLRYETGRS